MQKNPDANIINTKNSGGSLGIAFDKRDDLANLSLRKAIFQALDINSFNKSKVFSSEIIKTISGKHLTKDENNVEYDDYLSKAKAYTMDANLDKAKQDLGKAQKELNKSTFNIKFATTNEKFSVKQAQNFKKQIESKLKNVKVSIELFTPKEYFKKYRDEKGFAGAVYTTGWNSSTANPMDFANIYSSNGEFAYSSASEKATQIANQAKELKAKNAPKSQYFAKLAQAEKAALDDVSYMPTTQVSQYLVSRYKFSNDQNNERINNTLAPQVHYSALKVINK